MRTALAEARDALVRALRGPVLVVSLGYALLAALLLPAVAELALGAGPRAVTDLGLLGARLAALAVAIGVSSRASPSAPVARHLGHAAGALGASITTLGLGLVVWSGIAALLAIPAPAALPPWVLGATLELAVVGPVAKAIAVAAGRLPALVVAPLVVAAGHAQIPGLRWVVPDLHALDHHAALVGAAPPDLVALLLGAAHAALWMGAACVGIVLGVKLRDAR